MIRYTLVPPFPLSRSSAPCLFTNTLSQYPFSSLASPPACLFTIYQSTQLSLSSSNLLFLNFHSKPSIHDMYRESLETWSKAEMHWCTETQSSKSRDKSVMVTQKVGQNDERVINESAPRERGVVSIVGGSRGKEDTKLVQWGGARRTPRLYHYADGALLLGLLRLRVH